MIGTPSKSFQHPLNVRDTLYMLGTQQATQATQSDRNATMIARSLPRAMIASSLPRAILRPKVELFQVLTLPSSKHPLSRPHKFSLLTKF